MRALTIRQPWASLIAEGVKTIETRSWSTRYRGRIAIHAGQARYQGDIDDYEDGWAVVSLGEWQFCEATQACDAPTGTMQLYGPDGSLHHNLPRGAVVATAILTDCVPIEVTQPDRAQPDIDRMPCVANPQDGGLRVAHWTLAGTDDKPFKPGDPKVRHLPERPYGDFAPGRWAWLLDDIKPTRDRCPACWGEGVDLTHANDCDPRCDGSHQRDGRALCPRGPERCESCLGEGGCEPVPAHGRQGIWIWEPAA